MKMPPEFPDWSIESAYRAEGYAVICGADEAGRGPLAGPVAAGACILPDGLLIEGLNDSKKLTEKARERLYEVITASAVDWAVELVGPEVIDEINILEASQLAMRRAVMRLNPRPSLALIDGNIARGFEIPAVPIVKGDSRSVSIAAASILAKVTRDRLCLELDRQYPVYGFARHKGYPTREHREAILKYGPSPCHRMSFLKKLLGNGGV